MREDPEIIKLLSEEERLGLLTSMSQGSVEELETPGEVFEDMPDKNIVIFKEKTEKRGIEDNLVTEIKKKRKSGITVIGDVSWGTHLCQFYQAKDDLLDILVPYFKAGLENNEFCMWVTSDPLNVEEAKIALGKVVKDLDDYIKKGQIEILDYRSWYVKSGKFDSNRVLKGWVEKEKKALKKGFDGLRHTGNTFWLGEKDWDDFKSYEETINDVIDKHRMIAICSYSLEKCNAPKVMDVVSNHQFAIIRRENKWNIIESPEYKKTKDELVENKENYRSLVEESGAGIATTDIKGRLSHVNEAICKITGYSKSELIGKPFINFIHPDEKKKIMKLFSSAVLEPKRKLEFEFRLIHKNGKIITCYTSPTIVRSKGKIRGFNAIIQDITKRKRAEQIANEDREYAESIVDTVREPLIVLDADLKVISANRTFYQTFKTKPEETEGQQVYDIGNQQWNIPNLRELLEKILPRNASFENFEVEHVFPHIGKRAMLLNARRIPRPPAEPRIMLLAIEDITERKQTEQKLNEVYQIKKHTKELEMINENLDSFAYSVSHDLRAPLRAISGFAQVLIDTHGDKVNEEMRHYLARINEGAQKMGRLIDDLLSFSRSIRGEIKCEELDVEDIVNNLVKAHRDIIEPNRDINFIVNPLGKVKADKEMIKVVFANLLQNAVKYTIDCEKVCIEIGSEQKEDHIQFYVKDNGVGFDMKYKDKLFEPFQRIHTDERFQGSGIGLATVERIVSKHGGNVWAEGDVDKGATFYFTLPSKTYVED